MVGRGKGVGWDGWDGMGWDGMGVDNVVGWKRGVVEERCGCGEAGEWVEWGESADGWLGLTSEGTATRLRAEEGKKKQKPKKREKARRLVRSARWWLADYSSMSCIKIFTDRKSVV